jgi:hypothetical protein
MAQAAAMLIGLAAFWLMLSPGFMLSPGAGDLAGLAIGAAAVACAFAGARWAAPESGARAQPRASLLRRAGQSVRMQARAAARALTPGARLKPAFVKMKLRGAAERAFIGADVAGRLGAVVVEMEEGGFLMHTLDEDAVDPGALGDADLGEAGP